MVDPRAVSYTHLDVYKRQDLLNDLAWILATDPRPEIRNGPDAVEFAIQACGFTPVSYTHLIGIRFYK